MFMEKEESRELQSSERKDRFDSHQTLKMIHLEQLLDKTDSELNDGQGEFGIN